jgi:sulfate adenylyltransferase
MTADLPPPHGGALVDLLADGARAAELKAHSLEWRSWDLTPRQLAEVELLTVGAYSPLAGFMDAATYARVTQDERLPDGTPWPVPVVLDVTPDFASDTTTGDRIALREPEGTMVAVLTVESAFTTVDGRTCLAGPVEATQRPDHHDLLDLRATPAELRHRFGAGAPPTVWPTPRLLHRREVEHLADLAATTAAPVLVLAELDPDTAADAATYARIRCLRHAVAQAPSGTIELAVLPLPLPDDRAARLRAIVARNVGAGRVMIDRPSNDHTNDLADDLADLGIEVVAAPEPVRTDTDVHVLLAAGQDLPAGFTYPEVAVELRRAHPPRHARGFTVFLTGLSGSGKSTVANVLRTKLLERGGRTVTLLDGDLVRKHLSSELGFSKEHRDLNVLRIGFVASEISKHGGIAICAPIAPYDAIRKQNRALIEGVGAGYVLVHVATPLEVCEARDRKGLYAKARAGLITGFTGIDDPYEVPDDADVVVDTTDITADAAADRILAHLAGAGWLEQR